MPAIVLTTLNARYSHSAFGLRCLYANLGELQERACLREFTIKQRPQVVVDELLALDPQIVGLGVYIWNVDLCEQVVRLLKAQRPEVVVVLGGPEVSYEWEEQAIVAAADYLVTGEGDLAFARLCRQILAGEKPDAKVIAGGTPGMDELVLPYDLYNDNDVANRVIYVEASRGCPFRCEFCLSSLDKGVRAVALPRFLAAMELLLERGVQRFKFVDRTFNLDIRTSSAILSFFLDRMRPGLFLHFEMIPDRLPAALRELIARFPPGSLQFEVGIQSFAPAVNQRIRRKQKNERAEDNLRFLAASGVHVHADLIVGLPGESMAMFGQGFDRLLALGPEEIQVGILKRLRGTSLRRHDEAWGMVYSPRARYEVLETGAIPRADMERLKRFARYWDLFVNRGNFLRSAPLLWEGASAFARFLAFSDWLYRRLGSDHGLSLDRLCGALFDYLLVELELPAERFGPAMWADYSQGGKRQRVPGFLRAFSQQHPPVHDPSGGHRAGVRQERHRGL